MRFLPGNAQQIGDRSSQQDSFGFADLTDQAFVAHAGFLAIVCDGMGGMENGGEASRTAVRAFLEAYALKTPEETIPGALERSVHAANDQVVALARTMSGVESMGTTLVATAVCDGFMYFISVGDSGIFHVSGGQVRVVNRPHVFANILDEAVARGAMSREDADAHPERESLTSFIGAESLQEIDHNSDPWPMSESDTILLASDGLFKTLQPGEIIECLTGFPSSWPEKLVARTIAKQRDHQDNVTVVSVTTESELADTVPRTVLATPSVSAVPAPIPEAMAFVDTTVANKVEAAKPTLPTPAPAPAPASAKRPWTLFAVVLILAALVFGGWWHRRQRNRAAATDATNPTTSPALSPANPPLTTQPQTPYQPVPTVTPLPAAADAPASRAAPGPALTPPPATIKETKTQK